MKYKAMKFVYDGDEDVFNRVKSILIEMGYDITDRRFMSDHSVIKTYEDGRINVLHGDPSQYGGEEINIDWLRTIKPETIELNGKTYIKSELEEALRHIKPVGEE